MSGRLGEVGAPETVRPPAPAGRGEKLTPAAVPMIGRKFRRYVVLEPLAEVGGPAYLAEDEFLRRRVGLVLYLPEDAPEAGPVRTIEGARAAFTRADSVITAWPPWSVLRPSLA